MMDQTLEQHKTIYETAEEMFKEQEREALEKKEEVKEVKAKQERDQPKMEHSHSAPKEDSNKREEVKLEQPPKRNSEAKKK